MLLLNNKMQHMKYNLIAATNNAHKLQEIKQILEPHNIQVFSLKEQGINIDIEENGSSYKENALIKARAIAKLTSLPVISDDSGIEIEALDNLPGIHTARYAESVGGYEEAFKIIIKACKEKNNYRALFNCDIVLLNFNDKEEIFEGRVPGTVAKELEGGNGFGFDPIFISDEVGKTNASLSPEMKNKFSARSKALEKLIKFLEENKAI